MKLSKYVWRATAISAVLSTLLLFVGLVYAVNDVLYPAAGQFDNMPQTPEPLPVHHDGKINIVGLGDSLTKGIGDASGLGYIGYVKNKLAEVSGQPAYIISNLAVSGYRTDDLLADLTNQAGVTETIGEADIVVFTIGGNDLFQSAEAELDIRETEWLADEWTQILPEPIGKLKAILARLNEINPQATIIYVGLYNPFLDLDSTRMASLAVAAWNEEAFRAMNIYPNAILVPTADLFQKNLLKYLSGDHFHPNRKGYERIAERVVQALY